MLLFITATLAVVVPVQAQTSGTTSNVEDKALCVPGLTGTETLNCLMAGPAGVLANLAEKGLIFPEEPLIMTHTPQELFNIPFAYAEVSKGAVSLYASVDDAQSGKVSTTLPAGNIKYISYSQKASTDQGSFYQIATGEWISGGSITKVSIPYFAGFLISKFPNTPFGWVLTNEAVSYTAPDYSAPRTDKNYNRLDLIHDYDSREVNGVEWIMIGQNEWMEHRFLGIVYDRPTPPEGVTNGRWIEVNLYEQVLTVYDQGKMVFATLVSTGVDPFFTQPGTFRIYKKIENEYMTGAFEADRSDFYYLEEVPFILYFDESRALHGAYWNTLFGYQRSHGCVNLSVGDAHWLYDWANSGDTVYVWDPSGITPTDPSFYGPGGI